MPAQPVPFAWICRACGLLLFVALQLGLPPGALAGTPAGSVAPAITLHPAGSPCPTGVTVHGSGFAPGVTVRFGIWRDRDNAFMGGDWQAGGLPAKADGTILMKVFISGCGPNDPLGATFTVIASEYRPGPPPVFGPEARATFTATAPQPAGAGASRVALDPASGPCPTRVALYGGGFTPDIIVSFVLTRDRDGVITAHNSSGGGTLRPASAPSPW